MNLFKDKATVFHLSFIFTEILKYRKLELDATLSCPGTRDETCPPWDHIMSFVCRDSSVLCGMEIGQGNGLHLLEGQYIYLDIRKIMYLIYPLSRGEISI